MPGFQIKLLLSTSLILSALCLLLFVFAVMLAQGNIPILEIAPIREEFENDFYLFVYQLAVVVVLAFFSTIVMGLIVTHRVAGPLFAIHKYIDKLLAGETDVDDLKIRRHYELAELAEKLNRLKQMLKK